MLNNSLENTRRCFHDYVRIYDGTDTIVSPLLGNFCGHDFIPGDVISSGSEMLVIFVSDSVREYAGFNATYSAYIPPVRM